MPHPPVDGHHALLVASDDWTRRQLGPVLGQIGCSLRAIEAPFDARRDIGAAPPDVVVLDLAWRRAGALALLRALRGSAEGGSLPVVVLTGRDQGRDIHDALDAGANTYVTRPVQAGLVAACVRGLLGRTRGPRPGPAEPEIERTLPGLASHRFGGSEDLDAFGRPRRPLAEVAPDTEEIVSSEWALFKAVQGAIHRCLEAGCSLSALLMEVTPLEPLSTGEMTQLLAEASARASSVLGPRQGLRPFDGRIFCGVLAETDEPAAVRAVKQVRAAVEESPLVVGERAVDARATFGVAVLEPPFLYSPFKLVDWARRALQQASSVGGCGWWVYHPERVNRDEP